MLPGALVSATNVVATIEKATPKLRDLKKACNGLESSFLKQMLTAMHRTVEETKTGGDDTGADNYKSMFDDAIANKLAERGTLGISKMTFHATSARVLNDAFTKETP